MDLPSACLLLDHCQAIVQDKVLPDRTSGAALCIALPEALTDNARVVSRPEMEKEAAGVDERVKRGQRELFQPCHR